MQERSKSKARQRRTAPGRGRSLSPKAADVSSQVLHTPPTVTTSAQAPATGSPPELAARYGRSGSGARAALPEYVRQLWARRDFITACATGKLTAQYSQAKLGQIWQVADPLLNAAVYYCICGVLMG